MIINFSYHCNKFFPFSSLGNWIYRLTDTGPVFYPSALSLAPRSFCNLKYIWLWYPDFSFLVRNELCQHFFNSSFHEGRHNYNIHQALLENKHKITIKSDDGLQSAHGKKIEMVIHQLMYEFWFQHLSETQHLPIKMSLSAGVGKLDIVMFMSINSSSSRWHASFIHIKCMVQSVKRDPLS